MPSEGVRGFPCLKRTQCDLDARWFKHGSAQSCVPLCVEARQRVAPHDERPVLRGHGPGGTPCPWWTAHPAGAEHQVALPLPELADDLIDATLTRARRAVWGPLEERCCAFSYGVKFARTSPARPGAEPRAQSNLAECVRWILHRCPTPSIGCRVVPRPTRCLPTRHALCGRMSAPEWPQPLPVTATFALTQPCRWRHHGRTHIRSVDSDSRATMGPTGDDAGSFRGRMGCREHASPQRIRTGQAPPPSPSASSPMSGAGRGVRRKAPLLSGSGSLGV